MPKITLAHWMLIALAFRVIRAATSATWVHPDEWYQTLEPAHLLSFGVATWAQEIALHLRNQTWPSMLAGALSIAQVLAPDSSFLKLFLCQFLAGILDLGMIWGWWQLLRQLAGRRPVSLPLETIVMAALVLPWIFVRDGVLLSIEHLSTVAFWMMLGCLASRRWVGAGFLSIAVIAVRYPSGLLSFGAGVALLVQAWRDRDLRRVTHFALGVAFGLVAFGLPDALVYGRPWESLWMYLQYNVMTGLSTEVFGHYPVSVYWDFFRDRWFTVLFPLGVFLTIGALRAFWVAIKGRRFPEPWLAALLFYLFGHFLISHREARFMAPVEALLVWAAIEGWMDLAQSEPWKKVVNARLLFWPGAAVFMINAIWVAGALWGDTWKTDTQYFKVRAHLLSNPDACAVVTVKRPASFLFPQASVAEDPKVPIGYLLMDRHEPSWPVPSENPLVWANRVPSCSASGTVLIQVHRPDVGWESAGCTFLRSGAFSALPDSMSGWLVKKRWVSGAWYRCPSGVLSQLPQGKVESPLARSYEKIEALPGFGSTREDLLRVLASDARRSKCRWLCFAH